MVRALNDYITPEWGTDSPLSRPETPKVIRVCTLLFGHLCIFYPGWFLEAQTLECSIITWFAHNCSINSRRPPLSPTSHTVPSLSRDQCWFLNHDEMEQPAWLPLSPVEDSPCKSWWRHTAGTGAFTCSPYSIWQDSFGLKHFSPQPCSVNIPLKALVLGQVQASVLED